MTVVVVCDQIYYEKAEALWASLLKYWKGRVCILGINFEPEHKVHGFEYARVPITHLKSFIPDWPKNRNFYVSVEGGDFLDYFAFDPNEIIIKIDADMILQRPLNDKELQAIHNIQGFGMSLSGSPAQTLREEFWRITDKSMGWVKNNFPGQWGAIPLYCCGVIVARYETYKTLHIKWLAHTYLMSQCFSHHAASQWVFNWLVKGNVTDLGNAFHCGDWFLEMDVEDRGKQLYVDSELVAFNHTKFIEKWY